MPALWVRNGGNWRQRAGRPHYRGGALWRALEGMFVYRWTLVSEEDGPVYEKTWVRVFDLAQPTVPVPNVTMWWDGNESSGGPYRANIGWGALGAPGNPVEVILYQWTGSWSQVAFTVVPFANGGWSSAYQFFNSDQVMAEVRYVAYDDASIKGPMTGLGPYIFTW